MSYYSRGRVRYTFDNIFKRAKPIINIVLYSLIFLGFLVFSYEIILGDEEAKVENSISNENKEYIRSNDKNIATIKTNNISLDTSISKINVYLNEEGRSIKLGLEEYVKGVVCSEMPLNFNKEALKAQAIVARTYAMGHALDEGCSKFGSDVCDTVHCQVYTPKEKKISQLGAIGESRWALVEEVINETKGLVLSYNGELATDAYYFSTSSGKTENVEDVFSTSVPYLKSVKSPGEEVAPKYNSTETYDFNRFVQIVNSNYINANMSPVNIESQISIESYTDGGAVKSIQLGGVKITGVEFRRIFGLNSANFSLEFLSNQISINCKGFGHGVGMSQWGANIMAEEGKSCEEILKHYYTGINIDRINDK